jgi:hypothetical protein
MTLSTIIEIFRYIIVVVFSIPLVSLFCLFLYKTTESAFKGDKEGCKAGLCFLSIIFFFLALIALGILEGYQQ